MRFRENVVANRNALAAGDTLLLGQKPIVVIYSPQSDRNGAFMYPDFDFSSFNVLFWERENETDVKKANLLLKKHHIKPAYVFRN